MSENNSPLHCSALQQPDAPAIADDMPNGRVLGRQHQTDALLELLGKHPLQQQNQNQQNQQKQQKQQSLYHPICPQAVYIYGQPCTGKSTTVRHLLSRQDWQHTVWINCFETYTPRLLFESVLNGLAGIRPSVENGYSVYARCETIDEFLSYIREIAHRDSRQVDLGLSLSATPTRFLVLDKAEALRGIGSPTLLAYLINLAEWSGVKICVMFISNLFWDDFCSDAFALKPVTLHFPPYTKDKLKDLDSFFNPHPFLAVVHLALSIVALDCPSSEEPEVYLAFSDTIYDVFSSSCRQLTELRHILALLFPKYIDPVIQGKVTRKQVSKLFGLAQPHIKEALHSLYLRDISSDEWQRQSTGAKPPTSVGTAIAKSYDLPYYTKFLVIASYLASFNPPRLDSRFFSKARESKGKRVGKKGSVHNGSKLRQQLLGPKAFNVERMLAIFYSILAENVDTGFNAHTQIATLSSLRLLVRVTSMDKIDAARYKCTASYELVSSIGQSVRFDLSQYLFDFTNI
ncbi:hypothetical protein BASA61_005008 [Batrachochytrium salamandrivorans]|nr:hypothetical protein BASA61_005008 [Batrachochytrium salamandrivorans]